MAEPYTGDVRVGGPSDTRVLDELEIRKVAVGPMDNAAYLLTCRRAGAQLLVDAAADADRLLTLVGEARSSARLDVVVTTHRHRDHVGALAGVVAVTGARALAGADDADDVAATTGVAVGRLHDGDVVTFGHVTLEVVALRGHTPGSIALVYREPGHARVAGARPGRAHVWTGDSLFPGGVGRTAGPDDFTRLYDDVVGRLFDRLDDDTWIYPGHGADTTLGRERPDLGRWRERGW